MLVDCFRELANIKRLVLRKVNSLPQNAVKPRYQAMSPIGTFPTRRDVRLESGMRVKPDVTASLWLSFRRTAQRPPG